MSKRPLELYLTDIKEAIGKIEEYAAGMTFFEFQKDAKTIDAVVRNIEIIGEAAKHIPQDIRLTHAPEATSFRTWMNGWRPKAFGAGCRPRRTRNV